MGKINILDVRGLQKEIRVRKRIPDNSVCEVCGISKSEGTLRRFNDFIVCEKHYNQLDKYGQITDKSARKHKKEIEKCCICGNLKSASFEGKSYCNKHYIQIVRHGSIQERTIYDPNEYEIHGDYVEIKCFDKDKQYKGSTFVDLDIFPEIQKYKIYIRLHGSKPYAAFSNIEESGEKTGSGKKYLLHRFIMHIHDTKYSIDTVVDHINGNSLDNRISNLRICTQQENAFNNRRNSKIRGVSWLKANKKWTARIMHNYTGYHLGNYMTFAEAVLARLKKERELFGEFGPNKDLYYIIDHPSPIEEIEKTISIPSEGA